MHLQFVKNACQRLIQELGQTKSISKEDKAVLDGKLFGIFTKTCHALKSPQTEFAKKIANRFGLSDDAKDTPDVKALARKILGIATDGLTDGSQIANTLLARLS